VECDFVVICDKNVFCIRFNINDTMQEVHVQKRNFNDDVNLTATMTNVYSNASFYCFDDCNAHDTLLFTRT